MSLENLVKTATCAFSGILLSVHGMQKLPSYYAFFSRTLPGHIPYACPSDVLTDDACVQRSDAFDSTIFTCPEETVDLSHCFTLITEVVNEGSIPTYTGKSTCAVYVTAVQGSRWIDTSCDSPFIQKYGNLKYYCEPDRRECYYVQESIRRIQTNAPVHCGPHCLANLR